jgi:hypothetical protein
VSWVKLDDRLAHHRKVRAIESRLVLAAYGLYVASIQFAQGYKTDGRIRPEDLSLVMPTAPTRQRQQCATELVRVRLWDPHPEGGWVIHDYLEHNASADERREKARGAANARWHAQRTAESMLDACSTDASSSPLLSAPLHSTPLRSRGGGAEGGPATRASPVPAPHARPSDPDGPGLSAQRDGGNGNNEARLSALAAAYPTTEVERRAHLAAMTRSLAGAKGVP